MQPCTGTDVALNLGNLNFQVFDSRRKEPLSEHIKSKFHLALLFL